MSDWIKSSFSTASGNNCVEVMQVGAAGANGVCVRHSSSAVHGGRPILVFTQAEWAAFLAGVKNGEFD